MLELGLGLLGMRGFGTRLPRVPHSRTRQAGLRVLGDPRRTFLGLGFRVFLPSLLRFFSLP